MMQADSKREHCASDMAAATEKRKIGLKKVTNHLLYHTPPPACMFDICLVGQSDIPYYCHHSPALNEYILHSTVHSSHPLAHPDEPAHGPRLKIATSLPICKLSKL